MKKPLVSCIVVTYNSEKYIKKCLQVLGKVTYFPIEIIVVDNGSTDNTIPIAQKSSSLVHVYLNSENTGYAGGHTLGISKAKGMFVFLLNPDTTVTPTFLEPLVELIEKNSRIAAVQPLVYLDKSPKKINLSGKVTHYLGFDWIRDYESTIVRSSGEILSFSGSGVLLRVQALQKVGGLDRSYFMYYEDSDLSWRLRMLGYSIYYCAESRIYHDYKFLPDEEYQAARKKLFWAERNRLYTYFKNYSARTLLILLPIFLLMESALLVYFATKGWLVVKLHTYVSIWECRKSLFDSRRRTQKQRRNSDHVLTRNFESKIEFKLFDHPFMKYVLNPILLMYWKVAWQFI
ncbi:MAG: glycosyltransferase family 2 protein [Candidatus Woesebacteria bacterium]